MVDRASVGDLFRFSGRGFCGGAILLAIPLTAAHGAALLVSLDAGGLAPALAGLWLGALIADGLTGLVHWACDTWGDDHTRWIGPSLIRSFREHHCEPRAMLGHDWIEVNREPAIAASVVLLLLLLPAAQRALDGHTFAYAFLCSFVAYGAAANQLHQWAHMDRLPRWVYLAQRGGVILSPERHARHHRGPRTSDYCISTGWLNPALDRSGFWRALERGISLGTGAQPRRREAR